MGFEPTEQPLQDLELKPSEYVRKHLKFTPLPGEPVGWMIEQAGEELFMFSTDYPHPEAAAIRWRSSKMPCPTSRMRSSTSSTTRTWPTCSV